MTSETLAQLGGVAGALGLGAVVLGASRWERLAGLAVWGLGLALLVPFLAPEGHHGVLALAAALGLVLAAGLAVAFRRWPWSLAFLALAAAPARIPVALGDTAANLLVPLYVVVGGAALGLAWSLARDEPRRRELGILAWPLALLVLWLGLSGLWSEDPREAAIFLFFFALPFGVLAVALARLPWRPRAAGWLFGLLAAMALLFAGVGLWQWLTRDVFWNPKVIVGNAYASFYRVNSVFWDPSIYGRFLVVAILAALALLLFRRDRSARRDAALVAFMAAAWAGLLVSFSQSSFVALGAGVLVAALLAWRWRSAAAVALVAAVMIPVGVAAPQFEDVRASLAGASTAGLDRATRGRLDLIANGVEIARERPLAGVGLGGFKAAYARLNDLDRTPPRAASHTTPVTVFAETGAVGLALYLWLLAAGVLVAFGRTGAPADASGLTGIAAGLAFAALAVHSLSYNAFFEDPLAWGLLGVAALASRARMEPT